MRPLAPPPVDPDEARERVLEELSKNEYGDGQGFVSWLLGLIEQWLMKVLDGVDGSSAAQAGLFVVLLMVLAGAAVLVLRRTGMIRRGAALTVSTALDAPTTLSSEELRRAARDAAAAQRTDDATVLAMRALVRDLEERTLIELSAGMTAAEAAAAASGPFPELRGRLLRAAEAFDTAAYSFRSTGAKQAEDLLRLAEYIAGSTPDLAALAAAESSAELPA